MDVEQDATVSKRSIDKTESPTDSTKHDKKADKKSDSEDPKPRIVLTFRSEKPGAKSSNMKIVNTEEKQEETSPRRSNRTRKLEEDGKAISYCDPLYDPSPLDYYDPDDKLYNPKRSTRCQSKDNNLQDNVVANAIARKEKSYNEPPPPTRLSRRIKPTAKVLANEELLIGLESQNNARLGITPDKSPEEGIRTRRSVRSRQNVQGTSQASKKEPGVSRVGLDLEGEKQNQVMKLKHLCELGLKAIDPETVEESLKNDDVEIIENEEEEPIEIDEDEAPEDEEIDDDSEVISKLLEADADSITDSEDEDFSCSEERSLGRPRRSTRLCSTLGSLIDSDRSSPVPGEEESSAPRRRSSRKRRKVPVSYEDIVGSYRPQHKKSRPEKVVQLEDTQSEGEQEPASAPAAGGDEGTEAVIPVDQSAIIATCYCETPSNVHASPSELTEPVFCQAIEVVDGLRVGCSHFAARSADARGHAGMVRAGPRAPFLLLCALHAAQLRAHMCCPACGLFCTQGIFYQCSSGHLFHLECGLPYSDTRNRPGCPHCGVHSYRWQPANKECCKVKLAMKCSNKRIFLPDQREQCTQAYLGFSTLKESQLEQGPVIPEDLLPSPPIDLKRLCEKPAEDSSVEALCSAILAGDGVDQLIHKIVSNSKINTHLPKIGGGTCVHAAARSGNLTAVYLLQYAGADLNATDANSRTPLMLAVLALLDKSEKKSPKKSKIASGKDVEVLEESKESDEEDKTMSKSGTEKPKDEDLMKVIRYLVAAGCDVNLPGPDGLTALHMAAQHGGAEVCAAILSTVAAEVDPRDQGGWTPLVWAAENSHADVVRLLLSQGADAAATDSEGNAAVHWCALAGEPRALQLLLDAAPAAVAALNVNTDTPLHVAARQGHYACVVILLARGARTDVENSAGELPVEVCSDKCQSAISLNMQMCIAAKAKDVRHRLLSNDISNGKETYPIPCVNEVDDTPAPDDFTYVTSHVTPHNIAVDCSTQSLQGCACKDPDDCSSAECGCCVLSVRRWAARGRLLPTFPYRDPPMLFECNLTCGCNAKKCGNSIVTRASKLGSVFIRTQVFRCGDARGWGLRAAAPAPRGAPVALYCGELLTLPAADTRPMDQYMFALDVKPDLLEQCTDKVQLCVDAAQYGGAARFINHSCQPNLAPVRVFTCTRDLRLPTVALFATTDIAPGDELTFDYGDKFWSVKSKWMRCECGTTECRYPVKADEADS